MDELIFSQAGKQ
jgi:serine/threonine protein phosphatase PrpC